MRHTVEWTVSAAGRACDKKAVHEANLHAPEEG